MADNAKWFVVHTYSGYENKVAANIETIVENRKMQDEIFEVRIPMEKVTEVREDKTVEVERKMFPGYVLVKVAVTVKNVRVEGSDETEEAYAMSDEAWYVIRNTRGVTGFVGPEGKPVPLTESEIARLGVEKHVVEVKYSIGDLVTITDGPFEGFSGTVEVIDTEKNIVRMTISMFGRDTTVELELNQVSPVAD